MNERQAIKEIIEQSLVTDRLRQPLPLALNEKLSHQIGNNLIEIYGINGSERQPFAIYDGEYGRWMAMLDNERNFLAGPFPLPPLHYQD